MTAHSTPYPSAMRPQVSSWNCSPVPVGRSGGASHQETGISSPAKGSTSLTESGSARPTFIPQGIDDLPSLRADNSVDTQVVILLQLLDRRFGLGTKAPVDAAGIKTDCAHPALQTADWQTGRACLQHGMALVGFVDVDPRHSANHSIGCDFPRLLKLLDRALG